MDTIKSYKKSAQWMEKHGNKELAEILLDDIAFDISAIYGPGSTEGAELAVIHKNLKKHFNIV